MTVNVEGERIPLPDVIAALTLGHEFLVLPSGLFITTDRPEFDRLREVVAAAAELRERDGDRIGVGTHDLGLWAQLAEIGIVDAQAAAVGRARPRRCATWSRLPRLEPVGVTAELRPYQLEGFRWLAFLWEHGLGGILADDMGLGQDAAGAGAGRARARARPGDGPFLVVAPTSVVSTWVHEAARSRAGARVRAVTESRAPRGRRRGDRRRRRRRGRDVVHAVPARAHAATPRWRGAAWCSTRRRQVKNHQSKTYQARPHDSTRRSGWRSPAPRWRTG